MHGCSCRVDAAREQARRRQEEREGTVALRRHVRAHESTVENWTRHRDDRPSGVREKVWRDPLCEPEPATEQEARFIRNRRLRRRQLRQWGDDA